MQNVSPGTISHWAESVNTLPTCMFNFVRKAIQSQLPTNTNLVRWNRATNPNCPLCNQAQTNKHVLSNCSSAIALTRYTKRHNNILEILLNWISSNLNPDSTLYADLPHFKSHPIVDIFTTFRPDIAVKKAKQIHTLELTIS